MALVFFSGSGSPFAWRVMLALEHKAIAYEQRTLSFDAGDTRAPEFLAINPRGRVPAIDDAGLRLYESAAIVEYLEEGYPQQGQRLFPAAARERALVRRMVCEADSYFAPAVLKLFHHAALTPQAERRADRIARARDDCLIELERWANVTPGRYLAGEVSAADFTLYPLVALALRVEARMPDLALRNALPASLRTWLATVESLPYFGKTWPPHWV